MNDEIILIGPVGAGKSTLGQLLSEKLGLPQVSMDAIRFDYYKEIGYDEAFAKQLRQTEGFPALARYWKPFEAYAVERLLTEHHNCVIDFGAGHSVYDDETLFRRVQSALAPYKYVILLLPSPDLDESVAILHQRDEMAATMGFDFPEYFVKHPANHTLAKFVVYTKDKSPEESRDEILALVQKSNTK